MKFNILLLSLFVIVTSCSNDANKIPCSDDELYDQVNDTCVPRYRDIEDAGEGDAGQSDADNNNVPDMEEDAGEPEMGINCDKDGDGALSMECGGDDCDDNVRNMSPNFVEVCDDIDNDCSGEVNDGKDCTFFAHTGDQLYRVDVFAKSAVPVGADNLPNLQDIDTHPNGLLYGVTFDGLYRFDEPMSEWVSVGDFGIDIQSPNGMAIDSAGTVFVTAGNDVFTVDLQSGAATLLGAMGQDENGLDFFSSGDCVVNKQDTLFMTSKYQDPTVPDDLVFIDRDNASVMTLGSIGYRNVFALTSAWGALWGLSRNGELLKINSSNGDSELIHTYTDIEWFGAASTPNR